MKYTPRLPEHNSNITGTSPLKDLLILGIGLITAIVILYVLSGFAVDFLASRMSVGLERKMAAMSLAAMKVEQHDGTGKRRDYLQGIVDRLQADCIDLPYDFKIYLKSSPMANAAALPGGNIVIFSRLLDFTESENSLAFILAHELGHYAHRDHLRGIGRGLVFMAISTALLGPDSRIANAVSKALHLTELSFSRSQETKADAFALTTLHCAYGHVGGATDFFQKMARTEGSRLFGHYFSSHPENQRRIRHIEKTAEESAYPVNPLKPPPGFVKSG